MSQSLREQYEEVKAGKLALDMSRGRPCREQSDLSQNMLGCLTLEDMITEDGIDTRNYGFITGVPAARRLMGSLVGLTEDEVIVCGSSSLNIMFDMIMHAWLHGTKGAAKPWSQCPNPKFLCPVPGYDRHFRITEYFGFEMINIPTDQNGPDMDMVEQYVNHDPSVKGIWCVPKYSNPTGITYSDEVVRRFASLTPAADDFRIFWDNAYAVHDLYDHGDELLDLMAECKKNGTQDMLYEFMSTAKISFAGSGISAIGASVENIRYLQTQLNVETTGYNKVNMIRHVKYFKTLDGIKAHMVKHAAIVRPRFELVDRIMTEEISEIAKWTKPNGGYFITLFVPNGTANRIYHLCKEAGLTITDAGAPFPYHKDPLDNVLRLAPTSPSLEDLEKAARVLCLCVRLANEELQNH